MRREATRTLVVDDDPGLLGVYAEVLRDEGYDVDTAATGLEATTRLSAARYDLLVCDMILPDSSGLEVMRTARREGQDLPIVLITGYPTLQSAVAAVEEGASRYLQKPVSRDEFLTAVDSVLQEHRDGAREREVRARAAAARRRVEGAVGAAFASVQTACEPVVQLSDGAVVAYCAVTADRTTGLWCSLALVRAAHQVGRSDELGRALRRSAAAVRRVAGRGLPLLVGTSLADVEAGLLLEEADPLRPLAPDVVLDVWPAVPREGGRRFVVQLQALRAAGYRLSLPVPRPEERDLPVGELGRVDFLRLDADVLTGLESDPVRQALVSQATAAASEAGAPLLACGVATPERRAVLKDLGCTLLQVTRPPGRAEVAGPRGVAGDASRLATWWSRVWGSEGGHT
jgi:CheY-like chemotaxis protein/EAL domain-containing protein (putative c-di-GMP-specific phosphodiesterase class I)